MNSSNVQKQQPVNVLMCGPRGAGKTAVVHVMKHGKFIKTLPSIGADFETMMIGTVNLRAWEYGGRERHRSMNQTYYRFAKAFIYVIDSNDRDKISEVREELQDIASNSESAHTVVLILANKRDLPDAMKVDEIQEKLALHEFNDKIIWHLQSASAIQNEGIKEGFEWLADNLATSTTSIDVIKPIIETVNDSVTLKNHLSSIFNFNNWKKLLNKIIDS